MDLMNHLRNFFLEHSDQEAAIPGLGIFVYELNEQNKPLCSFYEKPPRSKAFVNYIAFCLSVSEEEAASILAEKVKTLLKSLRENRTADLDGVGTFKIEDNKVVFIPSLHQFPAESRFGLDEEIALSSYPDEEELLNIESSEASFEPMHRRFFKGGRLVFIIITACTMLALIVIASVPSFRKAVFSVFSGQNTPQEVLLPALEEETSFSDSATSEPMTGTEFVDVQSEDEAIAMAVVEQKKEEERIKKIETAATSQQSQKQVSSEKPKQTSASAPEKINKPAAPENSTIQNKIEQRTAVSTSKAVTPKSGRFYIIAGSFAEKANAEKLSKDFLDKSYSPEILLNPDKKLYMLSLKSFESMDAALGFKAKIRTEKGIGAWIYKQ